MTIRYVCDFCEEERGSEKCCGRTEPIAVPAPSLFEDLSLEEKLVASTAVANYRRFRSEAA